MLLKWEHKFNSLEEVNEAEEALSRLLSSFSRNNPGVVSKLQIFVNPDTNKYLIITRVVDLGARKN